MWGYRVSAHPRVRFSDVFLNTVCSDCIHETMKIGMARERADVCVCVWGERERELV